MENITIPMVALLAILFMAPGIAYQRIQSWKSNGNDPPEGAQWAWVSASVAMLPITLGVLRLLGVDTTLLELTGDAAKQSEELKVVFGLLWKVWIAGFLVPLVLSVLWFSHYVTAVRDRLRGLLFFPKTRERWFDLMGLVCSLASNSAAAKITLYVRGIDGSISRRNVLIDEADNPEVGLVWYTWQHDPNIELESVDIKYIVGWEKTK